MHVLYSAWWTSNLLNVQLEVLYSLTPSKRWLSKLVITSHACLSPQEGQTCSAMDQVGSYLMFCNDGFLKWVSAFRCHFLHHFHKAMSTENFTQETFVENHVPQKSWTFAACKRKWFIVFLVKSINMLNIWQYSTTYGNTGHAILTMFVIVNTANPNIA